MPATSFPERVARTGYRLRTANSEMEERLALIPPDRLLSFTSNRNYVLLTLGRDYPLICPRIARASEAGSSASVIGLPTTMWLAPAAMASAGVMTRT